MNAHLKLIIFATTAKRKMAHVMFPHVYSTAFNHSSHLITTTVVNQMGHGRICHQCVPSFENFVRDVNHVRIYTDYAILRRMHQQISDHEDCQAHPHDKSTFA